MSRYKPGARLRSAVSDTEVMVIGAPDADCTITCGGVPMLAEGEEAPADAALESGGEGALLGKRYVNEAGDLELLCVKPGEGALALDGAELQVKGAKPLPSSD